jgi:DNA repair photolyase
MNVTYESYKPKTVLNMQKRIDGGWFWSKYSAFPYMGCFYGCEYCYWRDEKYNRLAREKSELEDAFSQYIKIKENSVELLRKSLKGKPKEVIYIDSYQPIESKHRLARRMLEVCLELDFPVFINEKSPLLLKDLDILKKLSYLNVGWSIVFSQDDEAKKVFESRAPTIASRFKAMKKLSDNGLFTGTVMMPILPFICDTEDNIKEVVKKTRDNGGKYVLDAGLTLWGYCRTHYYKFLKRYDKSLLSKYDKAFDNRGNYLEYKKTHALVAEYCKKYGLPNQIPRPLGHYPKALHYNKQVAEQLFKKSREIMLTQGPGYRQFALLKAGWSIDAMEKNVKEIYEKKGKPGLLAIKGIGEKMSAELIKIIKQL